MSPLRGIKRIGFDVDETLNIMHEPWIIWMNERFGTNLPVDGGFESWDHPVELVGEGFFDWLRPEVFDDDIVKPIPGALACVNEYRSMGFEIAYVTSCPRDTKYAKMRWLSRWGFLTPADHFMPTSDKVNADVDMLVDDHIKNVRLFSKGPAVLVTRPHNANEEWAGLRIDHVSELHPWL